VDDDDDDDDDDDADIDGVDGGDIGCKLMSQDPTSSEVMFKDLIVNSMSSSSSVSRCVLYVCFLAVVCVLFTLESIQTYTVSRS